MLPTIYQSSLCSARVPDRFGVNPLMGAEYTISSSVRPAWVSSGVPGFLQSAGAPDLGRTSVQADQVARLDEGVHNHQVAMQHRGGGRAPVVGLIADFGVPELRDDQRPRRTCRRSGTASASTAGVLEAKPCSRTRACSRFRKLLGTSDCQRMRPLERSRQISHRLRSAIWPGLPSSTPNRYAVR